MNVEFSKINKIKNLPLAKKVNLNGYDIEIKQYLPLEDKINLIEAVIVQSGNGQEGFFNIVKLETYYRIEMIKFYTNIQFSEEELENISKLYDELILGEIWDNITVHIPKEEQEYIWSNILNLAKETTEYHHSALGIFEIISNNYQDLNFELKDIQEGLTNPDNLTLLKSLVKTTGLIE